MLDSNTNFVYIADRLEVEFKSFYDELTRLFDELGIAWGILKGTKDIWVRDFMPIQLGKNDFWGYKYEPDYLKDKVQFISDQAKIAKSINLEFHPSDIVFDGGNIVLCDDVAIICDKVFAENSKKFSKQELCAVLEKMLNKKVVFLPWRKHGDDVYGHSDGFVKFCGDKKVLMSSHGDGYKNEAKQIVAILENSGFEVEQMGFKKPCYESDWAYINFLQVGKNIIMPKFDNANDEIAMGFVASNFKYADIHAIDCSQIAKDGGVLHCVAWNIYREQK